MSEELNNTISNIMNMLKLHSSEFQNPEFENILNELFLAYKELKTAGNQPTMSDILHHLYRINNFKSQNVIQNSYTSEDDVSGADYEEESEEEDVSEEESEEEELTEEEKLNQQSQEKFNFIVVYIRERIQRLTHIKPNFIVTEAFAVVKGIEGIECKEEKSYVEDYIITRISGKATVDSAKSLVKEARDVWKHICENIGLI